MQIPSFHNCFHGKIFTKDLDSNTTGPNICEYVQELDITMNIVYILTSLTADANL